MTVNEQQVRPAVIVEIKEHSAPSEILRMCPESCLIRYVSEDSISIVMIQGWSIVGKIRAEQIEVSIAIIISHRGPHTGLLTAVGIVGNAR